MTAATIPSVAPSRLDLCSIRRAKGISLEDISAQSKISVRYLKAIEEGKFDKLPGGIFSTSYIRQYARAIDFEEAALLAYYQALSSPNPLPDA